MPYGTGAYGTETYGEGGGVTSPIPPGPTTGAGFPALTVEIAFFTDPLDPTPDWEDVSAFVRSGSVRRGRSSWLDRVSAGTMNLTVSNLPHATLGRRFDPLNPGGPWYGYLTPNRRIRATATFEGVTYPLFDGFIDNYQQSYEFGDHEATCDITASDAFAMFANIGLSDESRGVESAGARIAAILDNPRVNWPAALRALDTGSSKTLAESFDSTITALDALFEVDATEQGGRLFIGGNGVVVFLDRNTLVTDATYTSDQIVFGDDATGSEVVYSDLAFEHSNTLVRNLVVVENPVWGTFTAEDAASQATYGARGHSITSIDATPQAAQQTANNVLRLFKDPQSRVRSVSVKARRQTDGWLTGLFPAVLGIELGWRVGMKRRGANYTIDQSYSIEEISHEFDASNRTWDCEFGFGLPQETDAFWIWGTGLWGSTNRWAW